MIHILFNITSLHLSSAQKNRKFIFSPKGNTKDTTDLQMRGCENTLNMYMEQTLLTAAYFFKKWVSQMSLLSFLHLSILLSSWIATMFV